MMPQILIALVAALTFGAFMLGYYIGRVERESVEQFPEPHEHGRAPL